MLEADGFQAAETWFRTHILGAEGLAAFGFAVLVMLAGFALIAGIGLLRRFASSVRNAARTRAARIDRSAGFRILLSRPVGRGAGPAGKWLGCSLEDHLATFSFGAPFRLVTVGAIQGGLSPKAIAKARRRMASADADLYVWATCLGKGTRGLELHGLSRGGGLKPDDARVFSIALPGRNKDRAAPINQLAAYLIAKQLQPALSNPQGFRAEKIKLLAASLEEILVGIKGCDAALQNEIEADFCASGVRVAEELGDLEALDKVILLRRAHLERADGVADPERMIEARMDLGRALLARAEKQFDQPVLQEAIAQLAQAVEALRGDPAIQRAQAASDALFKAQSMIESRKRFSLNFGS